MKIIVSRLELAAALLFASKDESRFTLAAVCIEVNAKSDRPTLIATDGRRLAVIQSQAFQGDDFTGFDQEFQLLLDRDFLKAVCALSRALGGKIFPWIAFTAHADPKDGWLMVEFIGSDDATLKVEKHAKVEGVYPDWRKVVPNKNAKRSPINDLGINSEYVGDFARASKALGLDDNVIQMNLVGKDSAVEVKLARADYFYGLVMPCKVDEDVDYQPEFLNIVKDLPVQLIEKESKDAEPPEGGTPNEEETSVTISMDGSKPVTLTEEKFKKAAAAVIAGALGRRKRK